MSKTITGADGKEYIIEPNTNLSEAYLTGADLRWTKLNHADLTNADLSGANLRGADLSGAVLDEADLTDIKYNDETVFPGGFEPPDSK